MDVQTAVDNFVAGLGHCQNLVAVHRAAGAGGPGRRGPETSVNRGIIVMAVATWQAFVQDLALALRDAAHAELQSVAGTPLLAAAVAQWDSDFNRALEAFSTPGPNQTRALLGRIGFDPRLSWTWRQRGGRGRGELLVESKHVESVLQQGCGCDTTSLMGTRPSQPCPSLPPSAILRVPPKPSRPSPSG